MLYLLEHLTQVLTSDPSLTALVPADAITPTYRRPAESDTAVEYDISDQARLPDGKQGCELRVYIHSRISVLRCWEIAEVLQTLMVAKTLTRRVDPDPLRDKPFVVSQVRQITARREPRDEWANTLLLEYSLRICDLNGVRQNQ